MSEKRFVILGRSWWWWSWGVQEGWASGREGDQSEGKGGTREGLCLNAMTSDHIAMMSGDLSVERRKWEGHVIELVTDAGSAELGGLGEKGTRWTMAVQTRRALNQPQILATSDLPLLSSSLVVHLSRDQAPHRSAQPAHVFAEKVHDASQLVD